MTEYSPLRPVDLMWRPGWADPDSNWHTTLLALTPLDRHWIERHWMLAVDGRFAEAVARRT